MKVAGYVLMCQLALGLALESRALDITCPEVFNPNCDGNDADLLECQLPSDGYGCPTGKYCIPRNFKISADQTCENKCPPNDCGADQHYCKGGQDPDTGCPMEDYCKDKLAPNGQEQECDPPCTKGQVRCAQIFDKNGTPLPRQCVEPDATNTCPADVEGVKYDEYGCVVHDPPSCDNGVATCDSNFCSEYCKEKDTCAREVKNGCPLICEQGGCQIYEFECENTYDEIGCPKQPECASHPSQCKKTEFEADTGCPKLEDPDCDSESQMLCSSARKSLADLYEEHFLGVQLPSEVNGDHLCENKKVCLNKKYKSERGVECENTCSHYDDDCGEGQTLCTDLGFEKTTGCKIPNECRIECPGEDATKFDERGCQIFPEVTCEEETEKKCEGIVNAHGCQEEATCLPKDDRCKCPENLHTEDGCKLALTEDNKDNDGLVCGENMWKCFKGYSEADQCPMGYECVRKVPEGKEDCTQECNPVCDIATTKSCPQPEDDQGCPQLNSCEARTYPNERADTNKGEITCEKHCEPLCENKCDETYDENGCKEARKCFTDNESECPVSKYNDQGCRIYSEECPDSEAQQSCHGGFDEDNCPKQPVCIDKGKQCPPKCQYDEKLCSLGTVQFPNAEPLDLGQICITKMIDGGIYSEEQCENPCPPACEWYSEKPVFAGYDDNTGCKLPDKCIDKETPYQDTIDAIAKC